jgi:hypothetical protein
MKGHRLSDFQNLPAWPQKCEHLRAGFAARPSIAVLGGGIFIGANRILAPLILLLMPATRGIKLLKRNLPAHPVLRKPCRPKDPLSISEHLSTAA